MTITEALDLAAGVAREAGRDDLAQAAARIADFTSTPKAQAFLDVWDCDNPHDGEGDDEPDDETGITPGELARAGGWTETPNGEWWREASPAEVQVGGDRLATFMGSGPYVWAESAADAVEYDSLDQ